MYRRRSGAAAVESVITDREIQTAEYWHILRTPPNREIDAGLILRDLGFVVYCPMQTAWKRAGRGLRIRHRPTTQPAFVRYIFVGFTQGDPDWRLMFATGYIRGVVGVDGRPYKISRKEIAAAATRQKAGDYDDDSARRAMAPSMFVGDRIRVEEGPLRGLYFMIESVTAQHVGVLAAMLGQMNFVELRLDQVSKAA